MSALLDRLDGLKQTGPDRWLARCPSHDDKSPSLSIRRTDACWLIHCFAACDPSDILAAIGLSLSDLYDKPLDHHHREPTKRKIAASDALAAIDHEIKTAAIIIADVVEYRECDEATWQRLAQAASRIGRARSMCCPARRDVA